MNIKSKRLLIFGIIFLFFSNVFVVEMKAGDTLIIHTWEMHEIVFKAEKEYKNYYADVTCWIDLEGPGFSKRIYAFWNGDNIYIIRMVATKPGLWNWKSGSNQTDDNGLNNHTCLLYTSPSPRDGLLSRMPSS